MYNLQDWDEVEARFFGQPTMQSPQQQPVGSRFESHGSLALKPAKASALPYSKPMPQKPLSPEKRREKKKEALERKKLRLERMLAFRKKERRITLKRFREAFVILLAITVAFSIFAVVLYRQSQITALNFKNNSLEEKIKLKEQETSQMKEDLITNTDLAAIRASAAERLGMQAPGSKQILLVKPPASDLLMTGTAISTSGSKASVEQAKANLAEYFSTLE